MCVCTYLCRDKDADETSDAARDRRLQHVEDSFADAAALDIAVKVSGGTPTLMM